MAELVKLEYHQVNDMSNVQSLVDKTIGEISPYLGDVLNGRSKSLRELQRVREKYVLQLVLEKLKPIIHQTIVENNGSDSLVHMITNQLIESSSGEVKMVLSYPVVKEEIIRSTNNDMCDEKCLVNETIDAIMPFLREGIHKEDANVVDLVKVEIPEIEFAKRLEMHLKVAINKSLLIARKIHKLLVTEHEEIEQIQNTINAEYRILMRQTISFATARRPDKTRLGIHGHLMLSGEFKTVQNNTSITKFIWNRLDETFEAAIGLQKPSGYFKNIPPITNLYYSLYKRARDIIKEEFASHVETNRMFTKENATDMAKYAKQLLNENYNKLNYGHLQNVDLISPLDTKNALEYETNSLAQSFIMKLETEAIKSYGFPPGLFMYSKAYFGVMENVFPSVVNPFRRRTRDVHPKDEL